VRVFKHWKELPRGCEVPVPEDIKNLTEHGSEHPAVADPALSRKVGLLPSSLNHSLGLLSSTFTLG